MEAYAKPVNLVSNLRSDYRRESKLCWQLSDFSADPMAPILLNIASQSLDLVLLIEL
jgi:hypothetical protein